MRYEFAKLHGAGNDFVMIDDMADEISFLPEQVAAICDRHFGVGADGVIVVKPSPREECAAYMDYYNSDGTKAEMCGNGVRCFAKFLVDRGIVEASAGQFVADTLAGPKPIVFTLDDSGKLATATVDMGEPAVEKEGLTLSASGEELELTCVSMGNPHAVCFVDDPIAYPVTTIGPVVECADAFPDKTNVEFAQVDGDTITMRVWERGCGETLACGTGSCATLVAANVTGRCGRSAHLKLLGGVLDIDWREDGHVYLTGPAQESFTGAFEV